MTISRMLAAMLATAALIAPAATASPIDGPVDMHQSTAEAAARELQKQDLRPPVATPAPAERVADDGVNWATIGIGVGLSVLAFAAIAGVSNRRRRERVAT